MTGQKKEKKIWELVIIQSPLKKGTGLGPSQSKAQKGAWLVFVAE